MFGSQEILRLVDDEHIPTRVRLLAQRLRRQFGESRGEELRRALIHGAELGKQPGILDQVAVERMDVAHLHRLSVRAPFQSGPHVGSEQPVEAKVHHVVSFRAKLQGSVQRDHRLARACRSTNHGSRIGGHSPRSANLPVRKLHQPVVKPGQITAQTQGRVQVGTENLPRLAQLPRRQPPVAAAPLPHVLGVPVPLQ